MAARFRCVDAAVIRVAVLGGELGLSPWPDLTGDTPVHEEQWRSWLRWVWQREALVEAIEVASPVLARRVGEVCGGGVERPRRVRRVVESVVRYLLRMTSRATPFGFFAGVAPVRIGSTASVRWGEGHRATTRPDAGWLAEVVARLEARPEVLGRLPVVAHDLSFVRAERLVVPCQRHSGVAGPTRPGEVSVRHTRAVRAVIQAAQVPVTVNELIEKLAAALPGAPLARIEAMLTELVSRGVLVTSLRPPMDVTDPLGHVIDQLTALGSGAESLPMVRELRAISGWLARHDQGSAPGPRRALRASTTQRMSSVCDRPRPSVAVDLRVDCSVVLPRSVAREAEAVASVLARLAPHRSGNLAWRAWHAAFLERYGSGAVVPLSEVIDADVGLGYPAGYRGSLMTRPDPPPLARDRTLLRLAQRAALDGADEVVLDERVLSQLAPEPGATPPPQGPAHTELRFSLHAPTMDALDRGEFSLVVVSASRQAGTTIGRFLHLFEPEDRDRMARALTGLPSLVEGALRAQVCCPPLSPRTEHLARAPAVFPPISLGEHRPHPGAQIRWDDLAVGGDAHHLVLISMSRGRVVEPVMLNAVELARATHPLARFLCEITTAHTAGCVPFSWGAAAGLPFLPRVRYRRAVLRPATWTLAAADLPSLGTAWREWSPAFDALRHRSRIPDAVGLGADDVGIRLDLHEPAHLAILGTQLDRAGQATVTEAPEHDAYGWAGGRAHEIVIPLAATDPPVAARPARRTGPIRATHHPGHPPGSSRWLYAKLYGHPARQTDILTSHLPELLSTWAEGPPSWWFVRYRDPEPHLRLRIQLEDPHCYGVAAQRLGAWAEWLRHLGLLRTLVLDTYYPEVGRYGNGPALPAAEAVFAADSAVAIAQLTPVASGGPHPHALTAASFLDIAISLTASVRHGMGWLIDHLGTTAVPAPARPVYDEAMRLADPRHDWAALRATSSGDHILTAWTRRRAAVATYRDRLTDAADTDPSIVLGSLLHMHHIRMNGTDQTAERACRRLARAAALAWTTHHHPPDP